MRVFIGINFDEATKKRLLEVQRVVLNHSLKGNFTLTDNFHLTLKFLGEINHNKIPDLISIIEQISEGLTDFTLVTDGLARFGHQNHIFYVKIKDNEILNNLHQSLINLLTSVYKTDDNKFTPHITLGRKVYLLNEKQIINYPINFIIPVNNITLYESTRVDGKLTYIPLYTKILKGAQNQ